MQTRPLPIVGIVLAFTAFLSLLAVILTTPSRAPATFRGKNGRIAYGAPRGIFTMRPNGSDPRPLITARPRSVGYPDFSPNGKKIAFAGFDSTFAYQIYTVRADGSHQIQLTDTPGGDRGQVLQPNFSPNGKKIAFFKCGRVCAIYIMRADGTAERRVTRGTIPKFFPGGGRIAIERVSGDYPFTKWAIFTMRTNGKRLRRITHDGRSVLLDISPNGRKILFSKYRDERNHLYVMRPNGSHRHRLKWKRRTWPVSNASFSPNGRRIAVAVTSGAFPFKSKIYVLRANGTHQHRLTPRIRVDNATLDWGPRR